MNKKIIYGILAVVVIGMVVYGLTNKDGKGIQLLGKNDARVSLPDTADNGYIQVAYSQPAKKDRVVFGQLVPYGEVWRTGANEATEITFKTDAMFAGQLVSKGSYFLFTIPQPNYWEVILNDQLNQWGAFLYEKYKDKDVLHVKVPVTLQDSTTELFTITADSAHIKMAWDKTAVNIPVAPKG